jgi:hypothetical protein
VGVGSGQQQQQLLQQENLVAAHINDAIERACGMVNPVSRSWYDFASSVEGVSCCIPAG